MGLVECAIIVTATLRTGWNEKYLYVRSIIRMPEDAVRQSRRLSRNSINT